MKKLTPKDVQEGRVFHRGDQSVKVLRTETVESQFSSLQVVVFSDLRNRDRERRLPINNFCTHYKRRKK